MKITTAKLTAKEQLKPELIFTWEITVRKNTARAAFLYALDAGWQQPWSAFSAECVVRAYVEQFGWINVIHHTQQLQDTWGQEADRLMEKYWK